MSLVGRFERLARIEWRFVQPFNTARSSWRCARTAYHGRMTAGESLQSCVTVDLFVHPMPNHSAQTGVPLCSSCDTGLGQIVNTMVVVVGVACRPRLQTRLQVLFNERVGQTFFSTGRGVEPSNSRSWATYQVRQAHAQCYAVSTPRPRHISDAAIANCRAAPRKRRGLFG